MPARIELLRPEADWYESTRYKRAPLYPLLAKHGAPIVDGA